MRVQRIGTSAVVQSSETAEGWIEHPLGRFLLGSPQSSLSLARTTREHSSLEVVGSKRAPPVHPAGSAAEHSSRVWKAMQLAFQRTRAVSGPARRHEPEFQPTS